MEGADSMPKLAALLGLLALIAIHTAPARACDPNEECSRCLVSTFGHCVQHGNDPVCEARKLACQRAPAVVNTPGSPFAPGGPLAQGGPLGMGAPEVYQCIANMSSCPGQILARISYQMVKPIVDGYIGFLNSQVGNNVRAFDTNFISAIQQYYSVDIRGVRYATGINTLHGMNITIGNMIYFVRDMDFTDPNDAQVAYHELEHVVQYANRGGVEPFLAEYILKAGGSILRGGNSIDLHDNIDLENAANAKANQIAAAANNGVAGQNWPPQSYPAPQGNVGAFCYTQAGRFGPGPLQPVGSPCWANTQWGQIVGQIGM